MPPSIHLGSFRRAHDLADTGSSGGSAQSAGLCCNSPSPPTADRFFPGRRPRSLWRRSYRFLGLASLELELYGGSSPHPGRDVASAAADVARLADAFEVQRFAVMGASGGGLHALACAALLSGRVTGAVSLAGLAPFGGVRLVRRHGFPWRVASGRRGARGARAICGLGRVSTRPASRRPTGQHWRGPGPRWVNTSDGPSPPDPRVNRRRPRVRRAMGFDVTRIDAPVVLVQGVRIGSCPSHTPTG
jgi:pimeloyl-ACP methyl ester carboxylesterase